MSALIIRPITEADHAQWLPLWQGYQVFYKVDLADAVTASTWARLLDPHEPIHGLVAERDGRLLGFTHHIYHRHTWAVELSCYLNDLFVDPEQRKQGIAEALVRAVKADAMARGTPKIYWLTHETNASGRSLYDKIATRSGFLHYSMRG